MAARTLPGVAYHRSSGRDAATSASPHLERWASRTMRLFTTAAVAVICALAACSEATNGTGMISKRIGEAARTPGATEVRLGSLTTFGWDRVYVFRPGATREEMCKFLGAGRNACGRIIRVEATPAGHVAMVFGLQGQVTHFEFHALKNGRFDVDFGESGLPRDATNFRVRPGTGIEDIHLELQ